MGDGGCAIWRTSCAGGVLGQMADHSVSGVSCAGEPCPGDVLGRGLADDWAGVSGVSGVSGVWAVEETREDGESVGESVREATATGDDSWLSGMVTLPADFAHTRARPVRSMPPMPGAPATRSSPRRRPAGRLVPANSCGVRLREWRRAPPPSFVFR